MIDPIIFIFIAVLGGSLGFKVTTTQNPVYSGLYLVLLFFLGSAISFLLGLEFMALLFLLVYAGAIAVLVLFVVMMLDVKAIENPWSAKKKRLFYIGSSVITLVLIALSLNDDLLLLMNRLATTFIILSVSLGLTSYAIDINNKPSTKLIENIFDRSVGERVDMLGDSLGLWFHKEIIEGAYGLNTMWFIEFDSASALNDLSYLLYSTHAILLIIAGVILLIAMVGAISLTLQKTCPESLYRQLGRESKNAIFVIKEKSSVEFLPQQNSLPKA
uniref:NADH dehydrogenase subunit 6 n=1 Tax=Halosiphon tomentosus TaxID=64927 RepID=UPI002E7887E8|nr:NADH dehydrogenase subunit 6 [Halosiphon tomentosus]WBP70140.1 NADH dehydrogenase subunit 6 [Halosiphon tomentosus]